LYKHTDKIHRDVHYSTLTIVVTHNHTMDRLKIPPSVGGAAPSRTSLLFLEEEKNTERCDPDESRIVCVWENVRRFFGLVYNVKVGVVTCLTVLANSRRPSTRHGRQLLLRVQGVEKKEAQQFFFLL